MQDSKTASYNTPCSHQPWSTTGTINGVYFQSISIPITKHPTYLKTNGNSIGIIKFITAITLRMAKSKTKTMTTTAAQAIIQSITLVSRDSESGDYVPALHPWSS